MTPSGTSRRSGRGVRPAAIQDPGAWYRRSLNPRSDSWAFATGSAACSVTGVPSAGRARPQATVSVSVPPVISAAVTVPRNTWSGREARLPVQPVTSSVSRSRPSARSHVTVIVFALGSGPRAVPVTTWPVWTARRRYSGSPSRAAVYRSAASLRAHSPAAARAAVSGRRQSAPAAKPAYAASQELAVSASIAASSGSGIPACTLASIASIAVQPPPGTRSQARQVRALAS